ncbi:hypothetical protein [Kocuria marina]|uniref:hypothetical protein n=1 Tax=Kocuria marina TaxID=223184 RepID=UPI002989E635|nr:hypothetical protein [Kocuria marina]MCT2021410.1 hypothetical protein [Kocuria marina]
MFLAPVVAIIFGPLPLNLDGTQPLLATVLLGGVIILWICEPVPIPVGGRTAAVEEPLEGSDSRGILYYDTPDVAPMVARALSSGLRVAIHGIGDRAVTRALDLIEASSTAFVEELENSYLNNLGQERMNRAYPVRTFRGQGITAPAIRTSPWPPPIRGSGSTRA